MRMYALYDRNRMVLALFLVVAVAVVIVACVRFTPPTTFSN